MENILKNTIWALVFLFSATSSLAFQPTAAQLEQFNNLSPAQQAQALSVLKSGGGTTAPAPAVVVAEPSVIAPRKTETSKVEVITTESLDKVETQDKKEEKIVRQRLELFGYELFAGTPSTFAPATDIPIPATYIVGPGDIVNVQLFGKQNGEYQLAVSRDGLLQLPNLAPFSVIGLSFDEMKNEISDRIARQMIGVSANITLGALRSIRIFILGNAFRPGSYTVSSLSTMTNALFVGGGIKKIGSLRNIQLKRNGKLIKTLDLYDLLLKGDTSNDERLLPGDVLFIPPIGKTVGIAGEVNRPAIYEIKNEKSVADIIKFAGGTLSTAYLPLSQIERINKKDGRTILDIDLTKPIRFKTPIQDGDTIRIYPIQDSIKGAVTLSGHVSRPGPSQWYNGMRVSDLLYSIEESLLPYPELEYAIIKHLDRGTSKISIDTINLRNAITKRSSPDNLLLKPDDEIIVFSNNSSRNELATTINQLRQQATYKQKAQIVEIKGAVKYPGYYPLTKGMKIRELITAASNLKTNADLDYSILVRYAETDNTITVHLINLRELLENSNEQENIVLQASDQLYTFSKYDNRDNLKSLLEQLKAQSNLYDPTKIVSITGHVASPGSVPLTEGMRVKDLIHAGGFFTEQAYQYEGELIRQKIDENGNRAMEQSPINFMMALEDNADHNLLLQPHDSINVKKIPKWNDRQNITLSGEVKFPGTYQIQENESLSSVIQRAGGLTDVAFAKGAVFMRKSLQAKEQSELNRLNQRLKAEISSYRLGQQSVANLTNVTSASVPVQEIETLINLIESSKPIGRLVINLDTILNDEGTKIALHDGDQLHIPRTPQEVTIIGEVNYATSHLFKEGMDVDDYIAQSGGITQMADEEKIYVVRSDGSVIANATALFSGYTPEIGDTIIVPQDLERIRPLTYWTSITQILYQLGVAAAAWQTVGAI